MPVNIKTVRGRRYIYFEYYEDGKKIQHYCGPEDSIKGKRKVLELELEWLEKRADADRRRIGEIRRELGRIQNK